MQSVDESGRSEAVEGFASCGRRRALAGLTFGGAAFLTGCGDRVTGNRPRKSDITMAPQFVLSHQPVVPVLLEVDCLGVSLANVDNIFSSDPKDRSYALYFAMTASAVSDLSVVTQKHVGRKLFLIVNGEQMGVHPIDKPITNGILPVLLTGKDMDEAKARLLHAHLERSIAAIQYFHTKG